MRPCGGPTYEAFARRAHHQLCGLDPEKWPPAVHRASAVLRREGWSHRAHRSARPGVGVRPDSRERDCARPHRGAGGRVRRGVRSCRACDAARPLGRRRRDCEGGARAGRQ